MGEKVITLMPVSASGIGSFISVTIDDTNYKSTAVQGEFTKEAMDAAMEEIYKIVPTEDRESVELQYAAYLQAVANTEAEAKYRAEHPEEFESERSTEDVTSI